MVLAPQAPQVPRIPEILSRFTWECPSFSLWPSLNPYFSEQFAESSCLQRSRPGSRFPFPMISRQHGPQGPARQPDAPQCPVNRCVGPLFPPNHLSSMQSLPAGPHRTGAQARYPARSTITPLPAICTSPAHRPAHAADARRRAAGAPLSRSPAGPTGGSHPRWSRQRD